jgi:hypothetical protein
VYQRHDFAEEKRQALDLWAKHVAEIVAGPAGSPAKDEGIASAVAAV